MRALLLLWCMHRLEAAGDLFDLQVAVYDSGMNTDIETLRWRYERLERAAAVVKRSAAYLEER